MEIEFDPGKSEANHRERGFGFGFAARIFLGRILVCFARHEPGELRMKAIRRIENCVSSSSFLTKAVVAA